MSFRVSFCSCVFSVLLVLRLPRLGKRELILVLFIRFLGFCRFLLPLGVWEGLRFVIVALPGLFSYLFRDALFLMTRLNESKFDLFFIYLFIFIYLFCSVYLKSPYLLCFQYLSETRFLLGALCRRSKFVNVCHDLMQNHLSKLPS